MPIVPQTTLSSREFNQDIAAAKRAARTGPVVVTDRGEPAFVLLSHEEYRRIIGQRGRNLVTLLALPGGEEIDFEPVRLQDVPRPADLG